MNWRWVRRRLVLMMLLWKDSVRRSRVVTAAAMWLWQWVRDERYACCVGKVWGWVGHKLRSRRRWNAQFRLIGPRQHVEWNSDVRQWRWWRGIRWWWPAGITLPWPITGTSLSVLHWPTLPTHTHTPMNEAIMTSSTDLRQQYSGQTQMSANKFPNYQQNSIKALVLANSTSKSNHDDINISVLSWSHNLRCSEMHFDHIRQVSDTGEPQQTKITISNINELLNHLSIIVSMTRPTDNSFKCVGMNVCCQSIWVTTQSIEITRQSNQSVVTVSLKLTTPQLTRESNHFNDS